MSTLDTAIVAANPAFMAAFSEPVTLILADGTERAINAIVDRFGEVGMIVQVANSATTGYSADEAQRYGRAQVRLKRHAGGSDTVTLALFVPTAEEIGRPWHDAGTCTYRLGQHKNK